MASDILKLPDFTYDGNIGIMLDYFVGILMLVPSPCFTAHVFLSWLGFVSNLKHGVHTIGVIKNLCEAIPV